MSGRQDWADDAVCRNEDPELWYPDGFAGGKDLAQANTARDICWNECPVREQCLAEALRYEAGKSKLYRFGVRGGMFPAERAREAARLALEAAGGGSVAA